MVDFLMFSARSTKRGTIEIYPKFIVRKSSDLMIRGGDFYAIWDEQKGLWSTDELEALRIIDQELDRYAEENSQRFDAPVKVLHMWDAESGMVDKWHKYCQKQMPDWFHTLDEKLIFANTETKKEDYASKKLNYSLAPGDITAYNRLMSTLYSEEERHKIEWAVGSIINGDSKKLQKFIVLYGEPKSGKSTVLNIIQKLFDGYCTAFDARALGSSSNSFALEAFRNNPLVAVQHDGDLSRIEDNTRLNSLVSHELMTVNEKFKSTYTTRFKCFLFMGTNKPVKITDSKSGLIRRVIDVSPSGNKLSRKEYEATVKQINFELGAIADHCLRVYEQDPGRYDNYIPLAMLGASNDFYNFMLDSYVVFINEDGVTLKAAWEMYKTYCEEAKVLYPLPQRAFKEELKTYFSEYEDRYTLKDGTRVRSYYSGFKDDKFEQPPPENPRGSVYSIDFRKQESVFDREYAGCPAQYATKNGKPIQKWDEVTTKLSDLDTSKMHYVRPPENLVVIDFDIPDENGEKSLERNIEEASKWPPTYAELSKSGMAVHLHYIYTGDITKLSYSAGEHIEVKIFTGGSSLRRKLTKCNDLPVATISSGLPVKGEKKVVNFEGIKNEKHLRMLIRKNLKKEIIPNTKPSIDLIYKDLENAYNSGMKYDVSDMRGSIFAFAANSTNNADYCMDLVGRMAFKSEDSTQEADTSNGEGPLIFFDTEVFPNLFLVCWKAEGEGRTVTRMMNPSPEEIENLLKLRLVGFNNRRYDNHILYGRLLGYSNNQLFRLSQRIIDKEPNCFFGEAYNLSYTDVYDFSSEKKSLKKFEIELGIHHQELGLPFYEPVPEKLWPKVADYCENDIIATEAVFNARKADFTARQILADVAGMTVNDTTNSLTTRIIFGKERNPQTQFNYRNMGDMSTYSPDKTSELIRLIFGDESFDEYTVFDGEGRPLFPGYMYDAGKSTYRGEVVGEGGYVYAEQEIHTNVALLDINSMHPNSIRGESLFGNRYTPRFSDILDARVAIKHKEFDRAGKMLGGKLAKYLTDEETAADLAKALKIAINSVYGLTAAHFDNPFRDIRNVDNIVAKRGALFMVNLKHEVQKRGYTVAHIKTDSIKIPNADDYIIQFVMNYGKLYGYNFEHEATYERMCLVNDAVYIARYATTEQCCELYGKEYVKSSNDILKDCKKHPGEWTATGAQFAVPYVFKTLFSKEDIGFEDLCETKEVKTSLYLDFDEDLPDVSGYEKELGKVEKGLKDIWGNDWKTNMETAADSSLSDIEAVSKSNQLMTQYFQLQGEIAKGHDYHFVGKVGQFCPVKSGKGGGILLRQGEAESGDCIYSSVTGTKGYRWMESEMVRTLNRQEDIDRSYYDRLVDEAAATISKYGDFEWFTSDEND